MPSKRDRVGRRAFAAAIGASIAVHTIFFPVPTTVALLAIMRPHHFELADVDDEEAALPLEVELEEPPPATSGALDGGGPGPMTAHSAPPPELVPPLGSPSASASTGPASSAPPKPRPAHSGPPAGSSSAAGASGTPTVRDPIGLAGKAGTIAAHDPNVSLMLSMDLIRAHPAGKDLGPALARMDLWNVFFAGTDVDPVRDLDRLLIAGPSFRRLEDLVAVVKMKDGDSRLHHVIDVVREKATPPGEWVSDTPPVAKVRIGKEDHFFVETGKGVGMVVPGKLVEEAKKQVGATFPANKSDAIVFFMRLPGKALHDAPIKIPATIAWVRLSATLRADGSATVLIDMKDADADTATKDAAFLTEAIEAQTTRVVPLIGKVRVFDAVAFAAKGDHLGATTVMQPGQLREIGKIIAATLAGTVAPPKAP